VGPVTPVVGGTTGIVMGPFFIGGSFGSLGSLTSVLTLGGAVVAPAV